MENLTAIEQVPIENPVDRRNVETVPSRSLARHLGLALLLVITLIAPLFHVRTMDRWMNGMSDLMAPWTGAHVALTGGNPYAPSTTAAIQRRFYGQVLAADSPKDKQGFAYPYYAVFVLAPLAMLPWPAAAFIFIAFAIPLTGLAVLAWLRILGIRPSLSHQSLCVVLTLASWPFVVVLRQQQLTLVVLLLATAVCFQLSRSRDISAGVLLGLTVIKPQMCVILLAFLITQAILLRRWRMPAACLATISTLLFASFRSQPTWLAQWLAEMADYRSYTHVRLLLTYYFGDALGSLILATIATLGIAALWRLRKVPLTSDNFGLAISLALALTATLCPGTLASIYNQTLLLPGCLLLVLTVAPTLAARNASKIALASLIISFAAVPIAVMLETVWSPSNVFDNLPYANLLLPGMVTIALAIRAIASQPEPAFTR